LGYGDGGTRGDQPNEMGEYLPFVEIGSHLLVSKLSMGTSFTSIITQTGQLKSWGINGFGQLGYGDANSRGNSANQVGDYLPFVQVGTGLATEGVALGSSHMCGIFDILSVKCWGKNNVGQLGYGHTNDTGNEPFEMADYLPPVSLPTGVVAEYICSAWEANGVISSTGSMYLWGRNNAGMLGLGHTNNIGDSGNEMGEYLQETTLGTGYTALFATAGDRHFCALLNNFRIKCWGLNGAGQLGYGDSDSRGNAPLEMGENLPFVNIGTGNNVQSVHVGYRHTCAVLHNNSLKCWGKGSEGQRGSGDADDRGDGPNQMGDYLSSSNLGTGVKIQECYDYSPTSNDITTNIFPFYLSFSNIKFASIRLFLKIFFLSSQLHYHPLLSTQMLGIWSKWKAWLW